MKLKMVFIIWLDIVTFVRLQFRILTIIKSFSLDIALPLVMFLRAVLKNENFYVLSRKLLIISPRFIRIITS